MKICLLILSARDEPKDWCAICDGEIRYVVSARVWYHVNPNIKGHVATPKNSTF